MSSTRPAAKRIRSDQDHSKKEVKEREDSKQGEKGDDEKKKGGKDGEKGDGKEDEGHKDDDWLSVGPFQVGKSWKGWETKWRESCWCNKTAFVYCTDPEQVKFCHCEDCQRLHGAPMQHAAVFHKKNVRLDTTPEWLGFLSAHGEIHPLSSTPTPLPHKLSCRACGTPLLDEGRNMIMAFPPAFEFPRSPSELKRMNEIEDEEDTAVAGGSGHGEMQVDDKPDQDAEGQDDANPTGDKGEKVQTHRRKGKWTRAGLPDELKPQCHIFYERRVVDINDGLTKWRTHKDTEEMGEGDH